MKRFFAASMASMGTATIFLFAGCGENANVAPPPVAHSDHGGHEDGDHDHPTEGPHHGHLIELGKEEYHAELTHDEATHTVAIYLLDNTAKQSVPIAEKQLGISLVVGGKPTQFTLMGSPLDSDPSGKSSCFQLTNEQLCEALDAENTKGRINVTINGKPYVGAIEHQAHEDHEHKK